MCSSPNAPKPPPVAPEAPVAPDTSSATGQAASRRRLAAGASGTILTSSRGVTDNAATAVKTLLGQ